MPIFEFDCNTCGKRFSALVGVLANARQPACPACGADVLSRRVSRFARLRSEDETFDSLADESAYGDIENDPAAMRRWVRDMSAAMDEDIDEDMEQDLEAAMEEAKGEDQSVSRGAGPRDDTVY